MNIFGIGLQENQYVDNYWRWIYETIPYADGNCRIWEDRLLQHSKAKIEIIAWDSSKALVKRKDNDIIDLLIQGFQN